MILEKLKKARIFKLETKEEFFNDHVYENIDKWSMEENKKEEYKKCDFILTELCDENFSCPLTKEELEKLGNRLINLAKGASK